MVLGQLKYYSLHLHHQGLGGSSGAGPRSPKRTAETDTTRCAMALSLQFNWPHTITCMALCAATLVTYHADLGEERDPRNSQCENLCVRGFRTRIHDHGERQTSEPHVSVDQDLLIVFTTISPSQVGDKPASGSIGVLIQKVKSNAEPHVSLHPQWARAQVQGQSEPSHLRLNSG